MGALRFSARMLAFMVVVVLVSEVFFRFVLPACQRPAPRMLGPERVLAFSTASGSSGLFTYGRLCHRGGHWRVNNSGWLSQFDYHHDKPVGSQRVALLGDSYIEGLLTDADKHVDVYLQRRLDPRSQVYSFGRSAWYLEQYVAVARYAERSYHPDVFVVFLNLDDIRNSLRPYGVISPYYWQIDPDGVSYREVAPPPDGPPRGLSSEVKDSSALVRYLRLNAGLTLGGAANQVADRNLVASGTVTDTLAPAEAAEFSRAAAFMLRRLAVATRGKPVVFVADGPRGAIYDSATVPQAWAECRLIKGLSARYSDMHYLDLMPVFAQAWLRDRRRFEGVGENHWTAYGNSVVAAGLAAYLKREGIVASGR